MGYQILLLGLMAAFYACYFSKMISQSRRGIDTDQLGKGKEGFRKYIEVALKVTTFILPILQIISILYCFESLYGWQRCTGVVIEFFGVVIFIISVMEMKDNWRAGVQKENKTELVTEGVYSISRNPAFLGFDLMYVGILVAFFNWYLLFATTLAVCLFHLQIVCVEEEFLVETFGQEYCKYKRKVCRYLGRKFWVE